jgi:DNA recombination protein RmuC
MEAELQGVLFFTSGLTIGVLATWLTARYRLREEIAKTKEDIQRDYSLQISETEGRARYAEGQADQLNRQASQTESRIQELRKALDDERVKAVESLTKLTETHEHLEQQKQIIDLMKTEMVDTFRSHASAALESSNRSFLELAQQQLGKILEETKGRLGEHQVSLDGTIKPLEEMLKKYEGQLREIEKSRNESYGSISQQIKSLAFMNEQLQKETNNLVTALRKPQVSGSWGQMSLRRAAELSGMAPYCDFYEQVSIDTESGRLRPDMVVKLPNGRTIVVDAKAPVDAYLNAVSADSEEERKKATDNYIAQVRSHMNALGSKAYWDQFEESPELVVMYLPGETFFSVALEHDHKLLEDAGMKKVIISTPTTFIALLKAVAYGWQQEAMAKGAREINRLGKELYERFSVVIDHLSRVGGSLGKAVESYNDAVRSAETRLIPSFKRFRELGVSSAKELANELDEINISPRDAGHLKDEL